LSPVELVAERERDDFEAALALLVSLLELDSASLPFYWVVILSHQLSGPEGEVFIETSSFLKQPIPRSIVCEAHALRARELFGMPMFTLFASVPHLSVYLALLKGLIVVRI